ncbi:hypothetical protein CTRI78_v010452 [Colletotrichum trifolii]|uniref:LPXTG-motif cell wall anchor domain-containing protein n=1 Tax=Colletotrichum trifolii TaxID=5466 RepID=A0A4R8QUB0_COLTR|nr:hypothetical protein CTRI78_v010452 [Colletotrichum trifolii]
MAMATTTTAGFEAAGHAPTLNPTLSCSTYASAAPSPSESAPASASASASPSSPLSAHGAAAFHAPSASASATTPVHSRPHSPSHTHTHRQNHNSSKLPAFRFADLHYQQQPRLALPTLLLQQFHVPPSPVSPKSVTIENKQSDSAVNITATATDTATVTSAPPATDIGIGITTDTSTASIDTVNDKANGITTPTTVTSTSDLQLAQQHRTSLDTTDTTTAVTTSSTAISPRQNTRPPSLRLHDRRPSHRQLSPRISSPIHELPEPPPKLSPRSRASTFEVSSHSTPATPAVSPRRPASFPDKPIIIQSSSVGDVAESGTSAPPSRLYVRRAVARPPRDFDAVGSETPSIDHRQQHSDASDDVALPPSDSTTKEGAPGQRELILPKTIQTSSPTDDKRKSLTSRPPVSYRASISHTPTASVRVAPIRSFRSSGSRRSLGLDSTASSMRSFDFGDDYADSNQRDRTLRALEGRADDDYRRVTPPHSADHTGTDGDDTTGDVFMKIARQEPTRRGSGDVAPAEDSSAIARVTRISHRRPLSAAVPLSYLPSSPPQISRRLSDQQETSKKRARQSDDDNAAEPMARALAYRPNLTRDRPSSVHPGEDLGRSKTFNSGSGARSVVNTPRSFTFQDPSSDSAPYGRRRPSLTDTNTAYSPRASTYRQSNLSYAQTRTYNSSPLVPKAVETSPTEIHNEIANGAEGTESTATASTTAPSTVWDELDDLKSRIHRLELTGKIPATSRAAMSRASEDRPPTATNTTMSTSPKRTSGSNHPNADVISTTSSQRETQQPVLLSAVNKSKPFLSDEVARALETAATEALALANMMGTAGQPGPISSGASTIGVGTTLTDRQLRRKADSICRSLTELVLALSEESARDQTLQVKVPTPKEMAVPTTPTFGKTFTGSTPSSGALTQRRPSVTEQQTLPKPNAVTSPRALSKYEERRSTMLGSSALPSPRYALPPGTIPSTPADSTKTAHRKSSLFIGRTRRAVTEEPEDGRRSSMLLRTRRAGTEEPEDPRDTRDNGRDTGRQTSLLRTRRGTVGEDDEEFRFRAPSRAATELQHTPMRAASHTYHPNTATNEVASPASSALPRRRFGASALTSRLVAPSTPSLARRYLERTPERDTLTSAERPAEERSQPSLPQPRHFSLSHTSFLNRGSSTSRRANRDSTITNTSTAAQAGSYR